MVLEQKTLSHFIELLRQSQPLLEERYKVKSLGIFGSFVRNEQQKGSDLDVLVEFDEVPSLLQLLHLEYYLSDLLGVKVDLVMKDALRPTIGQRILSETITV